MYRRKRYLCPTNDNAMAKHFATLVALLALSAACTPQRQYVTADGTMLGTTYHVVCDAPVTPDVLHRGLESLDREMSASMSIFDPASRLSRVNRNETDTLDAHIIYNIRLAQRVNALSGGTYDVTIEPLVEAYGFGGAARDDTPDIDSLLEFVGADKIAIEEGRLRKSDPRVRIDLNSVAKGYTVDLAAKFLEGKGAHNYIVEIGGEIRARGVNPRGERWRVAIDAPVDGNMTPGADVQKITALGDEALATSGNYRRYFIGDNGEKITHTIDPRTGRGSVSRLLSATVVARDCATADAMATMFITQGAECAVATAEALADSIEVYFILAGTDGDEFEIFSTFKDRD